MSVVTCHHKAVGDATGLERPAPIVAHLHRAIDQLIVGGGSVTSKAAFRHVHSRQPSDQAPAFETAGRGDIHLMRYLGLAFNPQKHRGTVEKASRCIQPCGAHGVVQRVDFVSHDERFSDVANYVPTAFVDLRHRQFAPALMGLEVLQIL